MVLIERGTFVTRSVYQKKCEENKRLIADLKIVCTIKKEYQSNAIRKTIMYKWHKFFNKRDAFNKALSEFFTTINECK